MEAEWEACSALDPFEVVNWREVGVPMAWNTWEVLAERALGIIDRAVAVAEKREARMQESHDAKLAGVAFEVDDGKETRGRRDGKRTKGPPASAGPPNPPWDVG